MRPGPRSAGPVVLLSVFSCVTGVAPAQDPRPPENLTVEIRSAKDACYVHERVTLAIRIGVRTDFLRGNMLQPFRRQLDVPVRVEAAWWDGLAGALEVEAGLQTAEDRDAGPTFVLNDRLARGARVDDPDRPGFTVVEVTRNYFVRQAGELTVPGPTLVASHATSFREDFVEGRVPVDPREEIVRGDPFSLGVLPLPETGRPPEFGGAVGQFTVRARAEPRELRVGQSLALVIEVLGEGDLARISPPRLEALAGFHVYGAIEDRGHGRRRWTCDLTPLHAAVAEVPSIPFAFFDPAPPPGYRTIRTDPMPLRVRPAPDGAPALPGVEEAAAGEVALRDIHGPMPLSPDGPRGAPNRLPAALLVLALLLPWLVAVGLWSWLRVRARAPDRAEIAVREAARAFERRAARPDTDLATALADYLALRLRCPAAAVVAPELPARLRAAGVGGELATRAAELLDDLLAARFGGRGADAARERAIALVAELEKDFSAVEQTR